MLIPDVAVPAVVTCSVFTSIAFIFVVSRLYARLFIVKNVGSDEYLIVAAMLGSIAFFACILLQIQRGLGQMIIPPMLPAFLQSLWATSTVYSTTLTFIKLSITVQYIRLFRTPFMRKFLTGFFVLLIIFSLWAICSSIFTCWPVDAYWNVLQGPYGTCMSSDALVYSNSGLGIITDLALVLIPLVLLRNLQIPKRQKIILLGVFSVGFFACITSVIRLHALYEIARASPAAQSVYGVDIAIWSTVEMNIAIICACVPAIKPLVVKYLPWLLPASLLSKVTGRTRAYYANSAGATGAVTFDGQKRTGNVHTAKADSDLDADHKIRVQHSFEMNVVPTGLYRKPSRDGSEKALVTKSWQADCFAGPRKGAHTVAEVHNPEESSGRESP